MLDLGQETNPHTPIFIYNFSKTEKNVIPLQRVFHSIRFKVNKGRGSAESHFFRVSI